MIATFILSISRDILQKLMIQPFFKGEISYFYNPVVKPNVKKGHIERFFNGRIIVLYVVQFKIPRCRIFKNIYFIKECIAFCEFFSLNIHKCF